MSQQLQTISRTQPAKALASPEFMTMSDLEHKDELLAMMRALYAEDEAASPVDESRFSANVVSLVAQPLRGRIVLFQEHLSLCGYALLIPYWSNEFAGTLLFVDEMFVIPEARNRGIGRNFFKFLRETRPFDAVALALEVNPTNAGARRLYESLGFRPRQNTSSPAASTIAAKQRSTATWPYNPSSLPSRRRPPSSRFRRLRDAWNTRDPERVALAYSEDSEWRNRTEFLKGRKEIKHFFAGSGPRSWTIVSRRRCGASARTALRSLSSTNGMTIAGSAPLLWRRAL
jgi:GNAT superfamily N-acetyltransferase